MDKKDVEKITLQYSDGTSKVIDKGFFASVVDNEISQQSEITFEMVNISGQDLTIIISSIIELASELGMFNTKDDEEDCDNDN